MTHFAILPFVLVLSVAVLESASPAAAQESRCLNIANPVRRTVCQARARAHTDAPTRPSSAIDCHSNATPDQVSFCLAVTQHDVSQCGNISDRDLAVECRGEVGGSADQCILISDVDGQSYCRARALDDPSECAMIASVDLHAYCVAVLTHDVYGCTIISDDDFREACAGEAG